MLNDPSAWPDAFDSFWAADLDLPEVFELSGRDLSHSVGTGRSGRNCIPMVTDLLLRP